MAAPAPMIRCHPVFPNFMVATVIWSGSNASSSNPADRPTDRPTAASASFSVGSLRRPCFSSSTRLNATAEEPDLDTRLILKLVGGFLIFLVSVWRG